MDYYPVLSELKMFDSTSIMSFIAVVIGLFLIPGPAVLLVITRTFQGGA